MSAEFCALVALAVGLFMTAVALGVKAIWTVGPDAGRWAETSLLAFVVALGVSFAASIASDSL